MPVSEDEFERPVQMVTNQTPMSKAEQRKSNKPIMEKRRRARINHCLNELKTLILDAMKKDPARHSKLEKADILEMTVKHLQQIQRQQLATAVATDPAVIMRFKSGFDECAAEVSRYINRLEGIDNGVKQRLTAHLHRCVSNLQHVSTFPHQSMFSAIAQNCDKSTIVLPNVSSIPGDVNNNSNQNGERIQIQSGLQLIPSRLPTGELALLVPNSNHLTSFFGNATANATFQFPHNPGVNMNSVISPTLGGNLNTATSHPSAFTAVIKNQEYPSPTSTADVIKKEASTVEEQDCKTSSFPSRGSQTLYLQNYNLKVTEDKKAGEGMNEESDFKGNSIMRGGHEFAESIYNCEKFKTFGRSDGAEFDQKSTQRTNSSSFQRTVADSTTSFLPANKEQQETYESGFKPFQVEIPNSHLKAHISISKNFDVKPSLQVHQKPNPNFTLNPNKLYHKSPYKFTRNHGSPENNLQELGKCEIGFEKFTKIEPICTTTKGDVSNEGALIKNTKNLMSLMRSGSSETFQSVVEGPGIKSEEDIYQKALKREYLNESPDMLSPTACSEPPAKMSRLSLNVTLTEEEDEEDDERSRDAENSGNRCKRISVIVEDSSKSSGNEGIREVAAANVSSHKDMWRPW